MECNVNMSLAGYDRLVGVIGASVEDCPNKLATYIPLIKLLISSFKFTLFEVVTSKSYENVKHFFVNKNTKSI